MLCGRKLEIEVLWMALTDPIHGVRLARNEME